MPAGFANVMLVLSNMIKNKSADAVEIKIISFICFVLGRVPTTLHQFFLVSLYGYNSLSGLWYGQASSFAWQKQTFSRKAASFEETDPDLCTRTDIVPHFDKDEKCPTRTK